MMSKFAQCGDGLRRCTRRGDIPARGFLDAAAAPAGVRWRQLLAAALLAGVIGSTTSCVSARGGAHGRSDAAGESIEPVFINPYEDVDWRAVGHHDANLHTHTNFSDGRHDPHYAIDTYHGMGYEILALTDHDSLHFEFWPRPLYPWTELNDIYHRIKGEQRARAGKPYEEAVNEEWQNRDPEELGMVSIPGSEISRTHHLGSLFNDYAGGTPSEEMAFQEIGERGGLSLFFHPGRYERTNAWYIDYYRRHDHVVGMEVYNQVDRYPVDRTRWDSILHQLMPDRPVWGFANDDTHTDQHFGRNRNVFMLSDFTQEAVFDAMKKGHFYFFVPVEQGTPPPVKLTKATVDGKSLALEVEGGFSRIEWITYNPATHESQVVGDRLEISLEELDRSANFVRAVIIGDAGRTYTQPFGIRRR